MPGLLEYTQLNEILPSSIKNSEFKSRLSLSNPSSQVESTSTQMIPFPNLIIIDGLDKCNNGQAQVYPYSTPSPIRSLNTPIICLVVSRPETDVVDSFNRNEPLKSIHCRLAMDDTYFPDHAWYSSIILCQVWRNSIYLSIEINLQDEVKLIVDENDLAQDLHGKLRAWNFVWNGLHAGLWGKWS
jgi:hypothetical protein